LPKGGSFVKIESWDAAPVIRFAANPKTSIFISMDILVMVGQLVLSLSILIVLHEMGHFFPAKWFKTRVEKFYLFFDPWFSLFKTQKGETEYGIGWLPLGGYVKISGMIDESFDTEQMLEEPQPWEFRSKPAWQRLVIMVGGVTVNFILGFLIYAMIMWTWGEEYVPTQNLKYGVAPDSLGQLMGIQRGDNVLAVDTLQLVQVNPGIVRTEIIIHDARTIDVERNGKRIKLTISEEVAQALSKYENKNFRLYHPLYPFEVGRFPKKSPAKKAGIQLGDNIIALNGKPTPFFLDFYEEVQAHPQPETEVAVLVERHDTVQHTTDTLTFNIVTDKNGFIGAGTPGLVDFFGSERVDYTLVAAIPAGIKQGWKFLTDQVTAFGQMFKGKIKASDSLGSFITIGSMFGNTWVWERFWKLTAALSLILGFINLLPIPALDGGHVMFLLYEVFSGRKPGDKFMEYATMVGFVVLIGIMVYALGLDISRLF
jgi:regulator of sigma E protease